MEKIKIDELDRRTYYPMSFNEQMAWIANVRFIENWKKVNYRFSD